MEYPEWINENLREFLASARNLPHPDMVGKSAVTKDRVRALYILKTKAMLRCITSQNLKEVWGKAEKYYGAKGEGYLAKYDDGQVWLASAIFNAVSLGAQEAGSKWREDIVAAIEALLSLMEETPPNYRGVYDQYADEVFDLFEKSETVNFLNKNDPNIGDMSIALPLVATTNIDSIGDSILRLKRVLLNFPVEGGGCHTKKGLGVSAAEKRYFIRSLSSSFIHRTGLARRGNVMKLTDAVFLEEGGKAVAESTVINVTRDIVSDPESCTDKAYGGLCYPLEMGVPSP